MRISEQLRAQEMLRNIQVRGNRLDNLYAQLASQKQVNKPSDDPVKAGTILRVSSHLNTLEQNVETIAAAQANVDVALDSLSSGSDILTKLQTLAVSATNSTMADGDRRALAAEIDQLVESMVGLANQSFDGRYVLAGTRANTPPLAVERDAQRRISSVAYQGAQNELQFPVSQGRVFTLGTNAQDAFLDTGALQSAISLRDHLLNSSGMDSSQLTAALQQDLADVNDSAGQFRQVTGRVGAHAAELDLLAEQTTNAVTRATDLLSQSKDVDLAEIAVKMQNEQTVYQALLTASSKLLNVSLMNYL